MKRCMISRRALEDLVDAVVAHHALDADRAPRRARPASLRSRTRARRGSAWCRPPSPRRGTCSTPWPRPPPGGCRSRRGRTSRSRGSRPTPSRTCAAAMSAIMCATASCLPTGRPHCTRSFAHLRTIARHDLAMPTELLGIERRPSLSVVSAILSPRPSAPIRFSAGTRTSLKLMTALASARRPMKWQRCSTRHALPVGLDDERADLLASSGPRPSPPAASRACRSCTTAWCRSGRRRRPPASSPPWSTAARGRTRRPSR